jgi:formyltetrahydrofolate-dependent phosphoribosylglycinamide formyltransferase
MRHAMPPRLAVLASGRGSNLRVLLDYFAVEDRRAAATVGLVASDRAEAGALGVAREHGVEAHPLAMGDSHEESLLQLLVQHSIDIVVLAGYVRLVPPAVVRAYEGRMVNVHPALLPAFGGKGMYGGRVHRAVLESGVRLSGPTVHFVDELYDHGAIIAQWPVPVLPNDTEATLAARVLFAEHRLLPRVVHSLALGRIRSPAGAAAPSAGSGIPDAGAFVLEDRQALERSMDRALGLTSG